MFLAFCVGITGTAYAGEAGLFYVKLPSDSNLIKQIANLDDIEGKNGYFKVKWRLTDDGYLITNMDNYIRRPTAQNSKLKSFSGSLPNSSYKFLFIDSDHKDIGWTFTIDYWSINKDGTDKLTTVYEVNTKKGAVLYDIADKRTLKDVEPLLLRAIETSSEGASTTSSSAELAKSVPAIMSGSCKYNNGKYAITNMKFYQNGEVRITTDTQGRLDYKSEADAASFIKKGMRLGREVVDGEGNIIGANVFSSLETDDENNIRNIALHKGDFRSGKFVYPKTPIIYDKEVEEDWSYEIIYANNSAASQIFPMKCKIIKFKVKQPVVQPEASSENKHATD
jgi:hypothetical protein